jgi:hypothetical protein
MTDNRQLRCRDLDKVHISSAFDAGNIEVVDASNPSNIQLRIRPEPHTPKDDRAHLQWFYFQVSGAPSSNWLPTTPVLHTV